MSELSTEEIQFLTRFICESDLIEGIYAHPSLVQAQLEDGYGVGHVGALLLLHSLAERREPLTHETIQCIQGLITAEQHTKPGGTKPDGLRLEPEHIGRYRQVWVRVGKKVCPPPEEVPFLIDHWLSLVNEWQSHPEKLPHLEKLDAIALFHFDYGFIHPFADGNGRSMRAITYYLMKYSEIEPFVFTAKDRFEEYYPAFQSREYMRRYFKIKSSEPR
jgi:Fic family protein